jgi:hypothetical protein
MRETSVNVDKAFNDFGNKIGRIICIKLVHESTNLADELNALRVSGIQERAFFIKNLLEQ